MNQDDWERQVEQLGPAAASFGARKQRTTTQNDPKRTNSPDFHRVSHRSDEQLNKAGRL